MGVNVAVIGLISDTHGLLRPEALRALDGSDLIIHAGDVGKPEILGALNLVAPVVAVRGNIDLGAWASAVAADGCRRSGFGRNLCPPRYSATRPRPGDFGFPGSGERALAQAVADGTRRRALPQSGQCGTAPFPLAGDGRAPGSAQVAVEGGVHRAVQGPRLIAVRIMVTRRRRRPASMRPRRCADESPCKAGGRGQSRCRAPLRSIRGPVAARRKTARSVM